MDCVRQRKFVDVKSHESWNKEDEVDSGVMKEGRRSQKVREQEEAAANEFRV